MTDVIGPDGLNMGAENLHRKFRWVVRLYKDAKQVRPAEFLKRCHRPPLMIHATADKMWNGGGEMMMTFGRRDVEDFDEVWLALYDGAGKIIEEWDLLKAREVPIMLYTSHVPDDDGFGGQSLVGMFEEEDGEKTVKIVFEGMNYKNADDKWTNYSTM